MKFTILLTLVCVSLAAAAEEASTQSPARDVKTPGPPSYEDVKDNDKAMDRAVAKARESLGFFLAALKAKKADSTDFEVKRCFVDGDKVEHIWLRAVTWDGKVFRGKVDNQPLEVTNVRLGQEVMLNPEDLTDWMFVKEGKLMGGFTTRVLYSRLSPEEQAKFREQAEFSLE
jgi:uncharacterized protein YegJ (DUF2314 family)